MGLTGIQSSYQKAELFLQAVRWGEICLSFMVLKVCLHSLVCSFLIPFSEAEISALSSTFCHLYWIFTVPFSFFFCLDPCYYIGVSWSCSWLKKNPPAVQEMWVRFLGWADSLEKIMAAHSSILAWKIPWTEEPGGLYSPQCHKRFAHDRSNSACLHCYYIGPSFIIQGNLPMLNATVW